MYSGQYYLEWQPICIIYLLLPSCYLAATQPLPSRIIYLLLPSSYLAATQPLLSYLHNLFPATLPLCKNLHVKYIADRQRIGSGQIADRQPLNLICIQQQFAFCIQQRQGSSNINLYLAAISGYLAAMLADRQPLCQRLPSCYHLFFTVGMYAIR